MIQLYKRILYLFIFLLGIFSSASVFADGSKDLYPAGASGKRALLLSSSGGANATSWPFQSQGTIKVFVKNNEYIYLGSSAQGIGGGTINVFNPTTVPNAGRTNYNSTSSNSTSVGRISNRAQELAGALPATGGYTPFVVQNTTGADGIFEIDFISPNVAYSGTPTVPNVTANASWTATNTAEQPSGQPLILAWDVTVRSAPLAQTDLVAFPFVSGRAYTNVLNAHITGTFNSAQDGFYGKVYVLTKDGFAYQVSGNGQVGVGFTFFANNRGYTTGANGSGTLTRKSLNTSANPNVKNPNEVDDALNITHKLFYAKPANDLPATSTAQNASTWLKEASPQFPTVSNITFMGVEGSATYVSSKGAYVNFTSNLAGSYKITIPGNGNFIDRVLIGSCVAGANQIYWDGKAGASVADPITAGLATPPGTVLNAVKVQLFGAEVHFPFIDVEINPKGIIIEQLTTDGNYNTIAGKDVVYWDDSDVNTTGNSASSTPSSPTKPTFGVSGVSSTSNGHKFGKYDDNGGAGSSDWGNNRSIDTYSFVEGNEVTQTISATIYQADLEVTSITPSVTTQQVGNTITYTIVIKNLNNAVSVSDVSGATFGFEYPAGFTINSVNLTTNTGTIVASSPVTTATKYTATLSMTSGSQATYVITGTVGQALKNTTINPRATILRPADASDPDATDESTPTFSGNVDTECNGNPSGAGCNNIKTATGTAISNSAPVANADVNSANMNTTLTVADNAAGDILLNDTDVDGDALSVTKYTIGGVDYAAGVAHLIPGKGTITINANGSYTFVPVTNYSGAVDVITYTVTDGTATATSTLTLTVIPTNLPPVANPDTNNTNEDVTLTVNAANGILANDTDADADVLSVTKYTIAGIAGDQTVGTPVVIAGKGTITINADGSYTFVPVANYNGAVPVITYTISDGTVTTTSTLTLTVNPVNDPPVANPDTNSTNEDVTLTVNAANGLLINDTDVEGSALSVTKYTIAGIAGDQAIGAPVLIAGKGTITLNADGSYTFVPVANFNGAVPVITYTITDGTATTTSTLTLTVNPVNDPPVANPDTNSTNEDVTLTVNAANGVLANDTDVDGNTLTVTKYTIAGIAGDQTVGTPVLIAGKGTITLNADGSYTFVPVANYNGVVPVITYTITDGTVTTTSTLTLTVNPVNDPPVANPDTNSTNEDVTLTVNAANGVLNNDTDLDGDALSVTKYTIAGIAGDQTVGTPVLITGKGTITLNADGSYTFVPVANYNGAVPVITYTITDGTATTTNTLTLTVNPVNDAPATSPDVNSTLEDVTITVNAANGVLANDSDIEGDALSVTKYTIAGIVGDQTVGTPVLIAGKGTITLNADGSYTFVPVADFNGAVPVITYTVTDGTATVTNALTLSVTPVNDVPSFVKGADQTNNVSSTAVVKTVNNWATTLSKGPADENAQQLDFIVSNNNNTLFNTQPSIDANGSLTYTPAPNKFGKATVTVRIHDDGTTANGGVDTSAPQTFEIIIKPVGVTDTEITPVNTAVITTVTGNDGASGTGTTVVKGTDPANGTITVNPDGTITYTPNSNYVGSDSYTYILRTPDGVDSDPITVNITVYKATLTVAKDGAYFDFNGDGKVNVGDRINYTFIVTNTGTAPVTNITLSDVNATITGGPIASLGVGAVDNSTFTGYHTLTQADLDNSGVYNSATVAGKDPKNNDVTATSTDPTPLAPGDPNYPITPPTPACPTCTVTPIVQNGSMSLAKEGVYNDTNGDGKVNVGDRINYTFVVTNTGNVTLTNVTITDNNATVAGGPIASLAVGASDNSTFTAYHVLTQADIDNGGTFNLATAKGKDPRNNDVTTTSNDPTPLNPGDPGYPVTPPTPACPTCTVTPIVQTGSMSLAKEGVYNDTNGDGKVNVGDRINYAFTVTNTGNVTLTNLTITDNNATVAGGPIASLAVGASDNSTFTAYHVLTQADIDNGGTFNLATAKGKDPRNNDITTTSNDPTPLNPGDPGYPVTPPTPACPTCTVTPIVQTGSMTLAKEGIYNDTNGDGKVNVGDRINYTFTVTNTGNVTLTNVTITDVNATVAGGPIASLAVGVSDNSTFTAYHILTQADIDNGGTFNLATAKGKDPRNNDVTTTSNDPTPLSPGDPGYPVTPPTPACPTCTVTPIVQTGSMSLAKEGVYNDTNGDGKVNVGDRINYAFTVTNTGNVTLTNVTITDNNATVAGGPIASLAVGASDNSTFTAYHVLTQADIDNGGTFNLATAKGKDPRNNDITTTSNDPTPLNPGDPGYPVTPPTPACPTCTVTPIVQTGSMSLAKEGVYNDTNGDGKVNAGDRINYAFTVTNTGNVTLTNVTITDNNATVAGGPIASLAVGASDNSTFTAYHVLTQADIDNGGTFNLATAKGKDPRNNDITTTSNDPTPLNPGDPGYPVTPPTPACPTCTVTPIVQTGNMSLAKEGVYNDTNGDGKVNVGDRINYAFTVTNTGNVTLTNVTITDNNATVAGGPIASLAVGASDNSTFTAYHVLTQADIDNGGTFNLATAKGKDPRNNDITTTSNDPTPLNPGDPGYPVTPPTPACPTCTVTPIVQTGSMSLAKEGVYNDANGDGKVNVGDRINYTFVVTNTGNVTLTNVVITDANATVAGGPIASLAVGASDNSTFTAYHVLTQADIDNGGTFNLATAKGKDPRNNDITTTSNDPTPLNPGDPGYPVTPPTPACPTCTVTPIVQTGSMTLAKEGVYNDANGDGKVNVGDRINYTFTVTNTGNVTLTNVTITDNNATVAGGPIASLAVGASDNSTFTAYHVLTQADIDNGGVFNTATAKGKDPRNNDVAITSNDPSPLNPGDPGYPVTPPTPACPTCTVTPIVQTGSMTLTKDGVYNDTNGDGKVNVGDRINYTFVVTNTGNVTLTNVVITDANATVTGGPLASLAVGASDNSTFKAYHIITQADLDNRGVFNIATASGKDPKNNPITVTSTDPSPVTPADPNYPLTPPTPACPTCTVTPLVQTGSVVLVKKVTNTGTGVGGAFVLNNPIEYTFTITNTGNVSLGNITLTDPLLGVGVINVAGTLAPGASTNVVRTYVITAADIAKGNVTNQAVVNATDPANKPVSDQSGTAADNNTPTVTIMAKPPVAVNDNATTRQNDPIKIAIEGNDVAGSTPLVPASIVITVPPKHGTVTINPDGTVTYTPNPGYVGADDFTYTVTDTNGQVSNPAVVSLNVIASNPKAMDDSDKTQFNKPVVIPVIKNDVKDGADLDAGKVEIIGQPKNGTIKVNTDGTVTYLPNSGFTGKDSFTYRVRDAYGNWTNVATVNVTIDGFFIPNVITPDGDGKNDYFVIVGLPSYDRAEVEFYNRWGNQVYTSKNYQNNWNGENLNEGTYYYTIRLVKGNTINTIKGWVLIKR